MAKEEDIREELLKQFSFLEGSLNIVRPRRISLQVSSEVFLQVLAFVSQKLSFKHLCTITGVDEGQDLGLIYHLSDESGIVINIKMNVPKANPVLKTITDIFPSADIYERELMDLLGARVQGLAQGHRYPLTDDWPACQFPLRKDCILG